MWHLSPEELVDLAEGTRPEQSFAHLATCAKCRQRLEDLRQAIAAAGVDAEVPEPSPLFWDHLSARIREAVAAETAALQPSGASGRFSWRSAALVGAVGLVLAVALAWRLGPRPVAELEVPAVVSSGTPEGQANASDADVGPLSFVADLAESLDWEAAAEAGLTTRLGIVDRTLTELSSEEIVELERLLNEALSKSGAKQL